MGQKAGTGIGTFNQFWIYTMPLFGAYVADAHWGRYKTICIALAVAITAHVLFIIAALPPVIANAQGSLGTFVLGVIILGIVTGGFKPNVSPLIIEQLPLTKLVVRKLPSGERIIHDPTLTANRVYMYFYLFINIGALVGQLSMTYTEKYVGFWLAWTLPTLVYCICPAIMFWGRNKYKRTPPQGSVLIKALRIWIYAQRGRWSLNPLSTWKRLHDGTMWESVKPSNIEPSRRPSWMTFDDQWVDEVRRGFAACAVFTWYPLFWICYNQTNNNLTSQAALMQLNGLPNDVISNIDPLALIVLIPLFDQVLYPLLRRYKINFTPIKRITAGFYCGCAAMIWAAVLQYYIYQKSPCGYGANTCADADGNPIVAPINIGAQTGAFVLIAISEIFASVTSLEYAFSKAPKNMRSLVQAVALFTNAFAAAIGEALVPLADDPLLVWNYAIPAILAVIGGTMFWIQFRGLDAEEDRLNMLPEGRTFVDKGAELEEEERERVAGTIDIDAEEKRL
jgi:POT family proton-dependent oligopeptide transporter